MAALKGERPLYIGEFGPYIDGKVCTPDNVVPETRDDLDPIFTYPAVYQ